jgi:hypothetical protein
VTLLVDMPNPASSASSIAAAHGLVNTGCGHLAKFSSLKFQRIPINAGAKLFHVRSTNAMLLEMARPPVDSPGYCLDEFNRTRPFNTKLTEFRQRIFKC